VAHIAINLTEIRFKIFNPIFHLKHANFDLIMHLFTSPKIVRFLQEASQD